MWVNFLEKKENGETLEYLAFDLFEDIVKELKQHDKIKFEKIKANLNRKNTQDGGRGVNWVLKILFQTQTQ